MVLPPGPMTLPILSGLILIAVMRGAYADSSLRGASSSLGHHLVEDEHRGPHFACASASRMIS